jgi:competence protein ComGC
MCFTFVFLLLVSRLTNSRNINVKHRGTEAWKQSVETHQRNKNLETNSRNTNVKHIRGTKA